MNNVAFIWHAFISKPLWMLAVAQLTVISVAGVLGYYGVIHADVAANEALRQRRALTLLESDAIAQQLATLPPLDTLLQQQALLTEDMQVINTDTLTSRIATPLKASGATLLSLQQHPAVSAPVSVVSQPASPSVASTWVVKVSTNYHGALAFLQSLAAMPQSFYFHSLVVSVQNRALHMEIALSLTTSGGEG